MFYIPKIGEYLKILTDDKVKVLSPYLLVNILNLQEENYAGFIWHLENLEKRLKKVFFLEKYLNS